MPCWCSWSSSGRRRSKAARSAVWRGHARGSKRRARSLARNAARQPLLAWWQAHAAARAVHRALRTAQRSTGAVRRTRCESAGDGCRSAVGRTLLRPIPAAVRYRHVASACRTAAAVGSAPERCAVSAESPARARRSAAADGGVRGTSRPRRANGHAFCAEALGDQRDFGVVTILVGCAEVRVAVTQVRLEKLLTSATCTQVSSSGS